MKTPPPSVTPDRPYYAAEDFTAKGEYALYVHGSRCRLIGTKEVAEIVAKETNDKHEAIAKGKRLEAGAPDLLAALARVLKWQGVLAGCRHGVPMSEATYNEASADFNAARAILDTHS